MISLSVRDLFVNYGALEVLKGVSLEIEGCNINVLLGANGSGKSTLLKTISGLVRHAKGSIWFNGTRIDGLPPHKIVRLGIGHVPEGRKVIAPLTVKENLEMGAYCCRNKKEIKQDIEAFCDRFPVLGKKLKVKSITLSGGEQQILVIARALMSKPKLLIMDEPSQGLSPTLVDNVAETITQINQSGIGILLVEHNLRLGLGIANHVYVLENGKIAFEAEANDLSGVEYAKRIYLGG